MLTKNDKERGYPIKKEATAIFQLFIILAALLIGMFLLGQFFRDFNIFVAKVVFR